MDSDIKLCSGVENSVPIVVFMEHTDNSLRNETAMLFVGPKGSSDERVAAKFAGVLPESILPVLTVNHLVSTVDMTTGTVGILPLEDDIRGEFHNVYDALVELTSHALIVRTTVLEETIRLQVLDPHKQPEVVYSHPDVLTKYSTFFLESGIESVATANTSVACSTVQRKGNPFHAALAPDVVGQRFGLRPATGFASHDTLIRTRYGLLGHPEEKQSGVDYASILYIQPKEDRSGTLLEILNVFSDKGVNLRRLRSQSQGLSQPHGFLVELDGHPQDGHVSFALSSLVSQDIGLKLLGVFPGGSDSLSPEKPVVPSVLLHDEGSLAKFFPAMTV